MVLLGKSVLKMCSKLVGEHPCQSVISIKSEFSVRMRDKTEQRKSEYRHFSRSDDFINTFKLIWIEAESSCSPKWLDLTMISSWVTCKLGFNWCLLPMLMSFKFRSYNTCWKGVTNFYQGNMNFSWWRHENPSN